MIEGKIDQPARRRLRLGMVGGGRGAFIGACHRMAARVEDKWELVAGALSSDPEIAKESGADLFLSPERSYASWQEMVAEEAKRPDHIDAVSIVTPNHLHFPVSKAFLEAGFHVICDKPMTFTLDEALELVQVVRRSGLIFVLTQNNTGYSMVRQARKMVEDGKLGKIRYIRTSYIQDFLTTKLEATGHKQAAWRMDPKYAGAGGVIADIGIHAFNLAAFISRLELDEVSADLRTYVEGRALDDSASALLRYKNGATGSLWASQCAPGHNNSLTIGVYGDKGSLEWNGELNDYLVYSEFGKPPQTLTRGGPGADAVSNYASHMPAGHPEGYVEGFSQLYSNAAEQIWARLEKREPNPLALWTPTVEDGAVGLKFVSACVASSKANGRWMSATL
jgi:predicted dehydrogenase